MKKYLDNLVSVIVPVYNTPLNLLKRCFESIDNQSFKNIELIIVNDGSCMEVSRFCNNFKFYNLKKNIINQKNSGVSVARNLGIELAKGKYIAFLDSDDYIYENYIYNLVKNAVEEDADIVFTTANKIFLKKVEPQEIFNMTKEKIVYSPQLKEFSPYNLDLCGTVWGKLYKRACLLNSKFEQELKIGEDIVFNISVFKENLKYVYINTHEYQYIINDQSTLKKFDLNKIQYYEKALSKIKNTVLLNKLSNNIYYLWGCTFFRVIITNYIFCLSNNLKYSEKVKMLNELYNKKCYNECLKNVETNELKYSRRILVILIKYKLFFLLFIFTRIKEKYIG